MKMSQGFLSAQRASGFAVNAWQRMTASSFCFIYTFSIIFFLFFFFRRKDDPCGWSQELKGGGNVAGLDAGLVIFSERVEKPAGLSGMPV